MIFIFIAYSAMYDEVEDFSVDLVHVNNDDLFVYSEHFSDVM